MKEKVSVFTLGCKTNLYESRQLVAGLKNAGYRACEGLEKADIYIINTKIIHCSLFKRCIFRILLRLLNKNLFHKRYCNPLGS